MGAAIVIGNPHSISSVTRCGIHRVRARRAAPLQSAGFSLMELLLVMVLISLLAALVMPVATSSVLRAKEATLKENLFVMRKALDDYYADHGKYPDSLEKLPEQRYIRQIPVDPLTERSDTWAEVRSQNKTGDNGIIDVRSGSDQKSADEIAYRDW